MTENDSETTKNDLMPNKKAKKSKSKPFLESRYMDLAAWINSDKNGDVYVSVKIGLLGRSVQLYPVNSQVESVMENLHEAVDQIDLTKERDK